jgi:hypothetical protein
VWKTHVGTKVGVWAGRTKDYVLERKRFHNFVFANTRGKQAKTAAYEPQFFEPLNYVWARHLALFPPDINTEDDYGISRRLGQWGLSLEAVNQGISVKIIELICGWPVKW